MTVVKSQWIGLDEWMDELDRRTEVYRVVDPLERVLAQSFAHSQSVVASPAHPHVPTYMPRGRLQASGHTRSELRGTDVWIGEVIYDAQNDDGEGYSIYEWNRGGHHSAFIDDLVMFEPVYEAELRRWLREGR